MGKLDLAREERNCALQAGWRLDLVEEQHYSAHKVDLSLYLVVEGSECELHLTLDKTRRREPTPQHTGRPDCMVKYQLSHVH